eukprot:CAMPEP_0196725260 /NCGR_PEP_ID=MMETSP1091-20130531/6873_1 /TAXON_ID=302021 /ORGANISM="Rhodomonas sp., Strain CCMP768" /LENGTH=128 /DNA_ID=CAMNT_0042067511 /DNA_START=11 /DNA_END=395 /DNA_ORIENTATION=+
MATNHSTLCEEACKDMDDLREHKKVHTAAMKQITLEIVTAFKRRKATRILKAMKKERVLASWKQKIAARNLIHFSESLQYAANSHSNVATRPTNQPSNKKMEMRMGLAAERGHKVIKNPFSDMNQYMN